MAIKAIRNKAHSVKTPYEQPIIWFFLFCLFMPFFNRPGQGVVYVPFWARRKSDIRRSIQNKAPNRTKKYTFASIRNT